MNEKIDELIPETVKEACATAQTSTQKLSAALTYEFERELALMALGVDEEEEEALEWE